MADLAILLVQHALLQILYVWFLFGDVLYQQAGPCARKEGFVSLLSPQLWHIAHVHPSPKLT